jgi:hypothetical protein
MMADKPGTACVRYTGIMFLRVAELPVYDKRRDPTQGYAVLTLTPFGKGG